MAEHRERLDAHDGHDLELVAASTAADLADADADRARRQIAECTECAELANDLRAIVAAVRSIDDAQTAAAGAKAPRDFRLTPEQVARLRPAGPVARLVGAVVAAVTTFGRPVGATLATFGLVGVLVGTVTGVGPLGGTASAPGAYLTTSAPGPGAQAGYGPEASHGDRTVKVHPLATDAREDAGPVIPADAAPVEGQTSAWWFAGSFALLVLGIGLVLWSRGARPALPGALDR